MTARHDQLGGHSIEPRTLEFHDAIRRVGQVLRTMIPIDSNDRMARHRRNHRRRDSRPDRRWLSARATRNRRSDFPCCSRRARTEGARGSPDRSACRSRSRPRSSCSKRSRGPGSREFAPAGTVRAKRAHLEWYLVAGDLDALSIGRGVQLEARANHASFDTFVVHFESEQRRDG